MRAQAAFLLFFVLAIVSAVSASDHYPCKVRPYVVHDGDTFVAADSSRVYRLWGVDAPELDQPWGPVARAALQAMIRRRAVTLQSVHGVTYGRPVVLVTVRGEDVALALLRMGLAWHDPRYAPARKDYAEAMAEARKMRRGLWFDRAPVAPWKFRSERKYNVIDEEPPVASTPR